MTLHSLPKSEAQEKKELLSLYLDDPVTFCRDVLPHWFPMPMPWVHRGMLAIITRQADFLLNFGEEHWQNGTGHWTRKGLAKIVRHFTYSTNPDDQEAERKPIFIVRYGGNQGRTAVAIDMALGQFVNEILPRGVSKTTLTNAALLHQTLYELIKYFVYISDTDTHGSDQLETIKRELETNDRIHALWGNIVPERTGKETWREGEIETTTGVLAASKGRGSQVRGMNRFANRPDLIIMDDIENEESVSTPEQLAKTQKWYMKSVEPALTQTGVGRIINMGTIQNNKDISQAHTKDPRYTTIQFGAIDPDGDMLWPFYMSKAKLVALRDAYARRGQLYEFGLEYLSTIREEDKAKFKAAHVQRYRLYEPAEASDIFPVIATCIDPAISKSVTACPCAISTVGLSARGAWQVLDYHQQVGMTPREQITEYFRQSRKWKSTRHGVEAVAYQAALSHFLREEMFRVKHYFEINEIYPGQDKKKYLRIEGILQPRIASETVTFNQRWPDLETQFLNWPHSGFDGPDVLAMCFALCDPYVGLTTPEEFDDEGNPTPPMILREKTMENFELTLKDTGVP